jgi:O-methyltransferase involved in polyketide biosynthesis
MNEDHKIRRNSVYLSDMAIAFAHVLAKCKEPSLTADEVVDSIVREHVLTKHPKLQQLYEELVEAKQAARRKYEHQQQIMVEAVQGNHQ